MVRRLCLLASLLAGYSACQLFVLRDTALVPAAHMQTAAPVYLLWIRVDYSSPRVLFAGLSNCPPGARYCRASWVGRSGDAGATWTDLTPALGNPTPISHAGQDSYYHWYTAPILIAPDDTRLYSSACEDIGDSGNCYISQSVDDGLHWTRSSGDCAWGAGSDGLFNLAVSPISPTRTYAVGGTGPDSCGVFYSYDAGLTFHKGGDPSKLACGNAGSNRPWGPLVADPVYATTVYANVTPADFGVPAVCTARSDDGGITWSQIITPAESLPLQTFTVGTDPHYGPDGPVLAGQTADPGVPADRRYLSGDEGRTWTTTTCAGDLGGVCPSFVVDNVFGAGASYAFVRDGIYRFHGAGPADERLALSDRLPLAVADLLDVGAGGRAGDPIYLLGRNGTLYRSTDSGAHWQRLSTDRLPGDPLPDKAPPSHAPGTLYVPQTRHSVATPFTATYRRLSLLILGHPVTEAYWDRGVLRQDFDHLELELRGGKVAVADLGRRVAWRRQHTYASSLFVSFLPVSPVSSTATLLYFPQTRHTLRGDMLRFWRAHGGMAIFGAPISEVAMEYNGDGSNRQYATQWFQNARLERHPETHNPKYAILLGLLGHDWWPEPSW